MEAVMAAFAIPAAGAVLLLCLTIRAPKKWRR